MTQFFLKGSWLKTRISGANILLLIRGVHGVLALSDESFEEKMNDENHTGSFAAQFCSTFDDFRTLLLALTAKRKKKDDNICGRIFLRILLHAWHRLVCVYCVHICDKFKAIMSLPTPIVVVIVFGVNVSPSIYNTRWLFFSVSQMSLTELIFLFFKHYVTQCIQRVDACTVLLLVCRQIY
jgi:hypothetical protein